jgi:subtilisin family serine protease
MVGADQNSPIYEFRGGTGFRPITSVPGYNSMTVYADGNPLGLVETYLDYSNGSYEFQCQITPDTTNYFWRFMTTGTGTFDAWSYDLVPGALPDSSAFPVITKYKLPDTDQTIVSSFTCSPKVITVGSYVNRNSFSDINLDWVYDSTEIVGQLASSSSRGPTRDGRIKPEITATGEWLLSCAAAYDLSGTDLCCPTFIAAGGQHRLVSGTSFASPVVAGTAALYLQKNPNASYQEVKDAITSCPKVDQFTGNSLPNNIWGYGKINSYAVVKGCTTGINEQSPPNVYFENYPNPFSEQTTIHYDLSFLTEPRSGSAFITITDALGRNVRSITLTKEAGDIIVSKNEMQSGVYFYSLTLDGKVIRTNKLIVM